MITDLEVASIDVAILVGDLVAKQGRVSRGLVVDEDGVGAVAFDESELGQCVFETQAHFQALVQGSSGFSYGDRTLRGPVHTGLSFLIVIRVLLF